MGQWLLEAGTVLGFGEQGWGASLLRGALTSLEIAALSYLLGIVLGLLAAWAKLSGGRIRYIIAEIYTTAIRAIPELLMIIFLYYAGTSLINDALKSSGMGTVFQVDAFAVVVFSVGCILGAYATEVVRGAILAVPKGMSEAAEALALPPFARFWLVIFPLMFRIALPSLNNLWQFALKSSSLVSIVGMNELVTTSKLAAGHTKMYLLFFCAAGLLFLVMTLVSNRLFGMVQQRLDRGFR